MRRVAALAVLGTLFGAGCRERTAGPWLYDEHAGAVIATASQACFVTRAQTLGAGARLLIVDPGAQRSHQGTIVSAAENCVVRGQNAGLRGYAIRFEGAAPPLPFHGIGVAGTRGEFRSTNGSTLADVDGDRSDEFFRSCTSAEGVHLTIWADAPLTGTRRWHHYQPLGFDVSPTCSPAEVAP